MTDKINRSNYYVKGIYSLPEKFDKLARPGMYGGRVECGYIGYREGIVYVVDFTSEYPACGLRHFPYGKPKLMEVNRSLN